MGRRQQWVYHVEADEFPQDFPQRLEVFRDAASCGAGRPGPAQAPATRSSLFSLAAGMGLLHLLLPAVGEPEGEEYLQD